MKLINFKTATLVIGIFLFINATAQKVVIPYGNNPKTGHYADINSIKMYYEIYGKGKPLLLIHGDGGSIKEESNQIAFFSKHYKVIEADSRGQGKTNDNSDSLTYSLLTEDINAFLDYLHIDSALIFGQSDGAIIGLLLAARHPEKVKMLAAMSPNIRPDDSVFYPGIALFNHEYFDKVENEVRAGKKGSIAEMKLERLMMYHPHISESELNTIKAPVLLMTSDRDEIRLSHIIEIFRDIPNSNLCVLPGTIHFALEQKPKVFNETIYRFFTQPFKMPDTLTFLKKLLQSP